MKNYSVTGITGQSGGGKSTVCKILKDNGFYIIDADDLAKKVVEKGSICLEGIVNVFSSSVLEDDGTLNRKKLAQIAFSSEEKQKKLNEIMHPHILYETLKTIKNAHSDGYNRIVFDAPLLLESNCDCFCDSIIYVKTDESVRLDRIIKRDGITLNQAILRLKRQKEDSFYEACADFVIDGTKPLDDIVAEVKKLIPKL